MHRRGLYCCSVPPYNVCCSTSHHDARHCQDKGGSSETALYTSPGTMCSTSTSQAPDYCRSRTHINLSNTYAWSDSTIVLYWLDGNPRRLKTFVGNRVANILEMLPPTAWRHVPSQDNPADCASRGMFPQELLQHQPVDRTVLAAHRSATTTNPTSDTSSQHTRGESDMPASHHCSTHGLGGVIQLF